MGGNLMGLHVVILGDDKTQRRAVGPFKTGVEAVEWVGKHVPDNVPAETLPLADATTAELYFGDKAG